MSTLLRLLVVLLAGIGLALQPPTNVALARASGLIVLASLISFVVGSAVLLAIWLAVDSTPPPTFRTVPAEA